jgi:uncharacterized repeat protein (TIGR01451 family)
VTSHRSTLRAALVAGAFAALGCAAWAQPKVQSELIAEKLVRAPSGQFSRTAADSVKPGDLVAYTATYRNTGKSPADKLAATIPIPAGTTFVEASSEPAGAQASTDGVRFAAMPLVRTVRQADGSTRQEPVPLADYRYVRWDLGTLPASGQRAVALRVRIDAAADTAAAKP